MARCRWETIEGERVFMPSCAGGILHHDCENPMDHCYCPSDATLRKRLKALESEAEWMRAEMKRMGVNPEV